MLLHLTSLALAAAMGVTPGAMARPDIRAVADSDPIITVEALTKMTTFWSSFMKEPDSIRNEGRKANQKQINISVGQQPQPITGVDMATMATKYSPVATDLKKAGLTAAQWESYRVALISASATQQTGAAGSVAATSGLAKNIAFLGAHEKEFNALKATGMWFPQPQQGGGGGGDDDLNP